MPATNPRLTVTLQEHTALQLRRLSELTGDSQSKLVGDILFESRPVFDRLITVLEAAQKAKDAVKSASADRLAAAQKQIEQQLGLVFDGFDELTGSLLSDVEAVARRARRQAPGQGLPGTAPAGARAGKGAPHRGEKVPVRAAPTPPSNRGVRLNPKSSESLKATDSYVVPVSVSGKSAANPKKSSVASTATKLKVKR